MTFVFEKFLKQYHSNGSQKSDGYDESHFRGMTTEEKGKAFDLLKNEAIAPGVGEWLIYLDQDRALKHLEDTANSLDENHAKEKSGIYKTLIPYSPNKGYDKKLVESYSRAGSKDKDSILWLVRTSDVSAMDKIAFYRNCILREIDPSPLELASDFYLSTIGIPKKTPEEKKIFFQLRSKLATSELIEREDLLTALTQA
jgi:hypothetical protein